MEPSDYDEIPLCNILNLLEARDYWRNKVGEDAEQIRNGRDARVAFSVHPTHTHKVLHESAIFRILQVYWSTEMPPTDLAW
jgi:hypothetical protein